MAYGNISSCIEIIDRKLTLDDDIENIVKNLPDKYAIIINLKKYADIVKKINELSELDKINLFFILNYYYHIEGESLIEDIIFDKLLENFPQYEIDIFDNKTELPYPMPGLKKIYPDNKKTLMDNLKKFPNYTINISSKLDGISCLLVKNKDVIDIYTKGKDNIGRKINYILKYINTNAIQNISPKKIVLRGELIIKKEHNKYFNIKTSLRSQVIGLINKKTLNKNLLKYIDLVFYEVKYPLMSKFDQLNLIDRLKLNLVKNINIDISKEQNIISFLIQLYKKFLDEEIYDIDGLVISDSNTIIKDSNDYIFAFKFNTIYAISKVVNIQWIISKDYKYIPTILIEPVILDKIRVSKISGFNAAYVLKNQIGIGAEIKIKYSGNVIPTLDNVIKPNKNIPVPSDVVWDKNKIHLISNNTDIIESLAKQIEKFYIVFKIKSFAHKSILKVLINLSETHSIKSIFDYINTLKECEANNIRILGEVKDMLLYESIKLFSTIHISITSLLAATNKFKLMDERKILNILKNSNIAINIISRKQPLCFLTIENLKQIDDVSDITANNFINGLKYYMDNIDEFERNFNINYNIIHKDKILKIVFTNVKTKLKQCLEQYNDYYVEYLNVTKEINYVIIPDSKEDDHLTEKQKKALKYDIPIIPISEFVNILKKLKK